MMNSKKGFTLIELLVVVGILAVLAIAALIAINPIEAQRRSRDTARLQDMARLQSAMEVNVNDNGYTGLANRNSGAVTNRQDTCGATGWLGVDMCQYLKALPRDPINGRPISVVNVAAGSRGAQTARYGFTVDAATGAFSFCTYLEADGSRNTLTSDPIPATNQFETTVFPCTP